MDFENSSTAPMKRLPMIVDIAIDTNGKQMYQVHETSKLVRKEMPKSTNFSDSTMGSLDLSAGDSATGDFSTGAILPPIHHKVKGSTDSLLDSDTKSDDGEFDDSAESPDSSAVGSGGSSADNIWSKDVESAFEEVLAIVPKNGLNKIKIGGRSCGRNELISDFILAKTGKFRSRKQVSSHIQVIKNMGSKKKIIQLINEGPSFSSTDEFKENSKRFEEIFTKINLNKSLGMNSAFSLKSFTGPTRRHSSGNMNSAPAKRRKLLDSYVDVRNICFSIEDLVMGSRPILLSVQDETPTTSLTVKDNAANSSRFPGLEEFSDTSVPIIHNMVRIHSPLQLPANFNIENGLKTSYMLDIGSTTELISSFTTVYSFGTEVMKVNEEDFQTNTNQPFLLKFWKCFFINLLHQPASLDAAFKGTTVKQVIYDSMPGSVHMVPKNKIKAVVLWEFAKVDDFKLAKTTTSRLFLPPTLGYPSLMSASTNYYTPLTQPQLSAPITQDPLEYEQLHSRPMPTFNEPEMDVNFMAQHTFPNPSASFAPLQYLYGHHPSVNVNLGSIKVKDEADYGASFY